MAKQATRRPWRLHRPHPEAEALGRRLEVSRVVGQLLLNRGLADAEEARRWLAVPWAGLTRPEELPGAAEAGLLLAEEARRGGRICVYGDYDVDGTTGASILFRALRRMGADATVYLPHRLEEGYGLNAGAVRRIAQAGHTSLVTVDCGIGSPEEVALARSLGLRVAVTDHHQPKESGLPQADAIAHPALAGRAAPLAAAGLCGSAVAWKTAWAALAAWRKAQGGGLTAEDKEHLKDSMVLAALGTVADVVPLHGENRLLVRHGLARLGGTADEGLKAILAVCGLGGLVLAEDVGFKIGPRFNAAGRLGQAMRVVELLTGTGTGAGGPEAMAELAGHLDWANRTRQRIEREIVAEAREQAEAQVEAGRAALVVSSPHWHPGVIGIVASRLVERFQRPALVVSFGTASGLGYGSGRSTPSLPLHAALAACTRHLAVHGGHAMAAGFKVRPESLDAFREAFWAHASGTFGGVPPPQPLVMEANMSLGDVTAGLVRDLERLEPHGAGNPRPLFYLGGCRIESARVIGQDGTHLSLTVSHPTSRSVRCIAFGMAERKDELRGFVDLAAVPRINEWQGRVSAELEIKDIRQAEARRPGQGGGDA